MNLTVGYFGRPGGFGGLTHVVVTDHKGDKPICGCRLHPANEYQWCAPEELLEPECERCKKKQIQLKAAIAKVLNQKS